MTMTNRVGLIGTVYYVPAQQERSGDIDGKRPKEYGSGFVAIINLHSIGIIWKSTG